MNPIMKQSRHESLLLYFPASLENIDYVITEIEKFLVQKKFDKFLFEVILGSREALINAVLYGCKSNQDEKIKVELRIKSDRLIIEVDDQGKGFEWQRQLEKVLPDKETSGRGLYVMKTYFNTIFYNKTGNKLTLIKKLFKEDQ